MGMRPIEELMFFTLRGSLTLIVARLLFWCYGSLPMDLRTSCFLRVVAPCVFLAGILPAVARAHELDASVTLVAPAVVIRAAYGGSDPVPFAKVQVFAPSPSKEQFQKQELPIDEVISALSLRDRVPGAL